MAIPVLSNDQARPVAIVGSATTATRTVVTDSATSKTVLAANPNRIGAVINNGSTAVLYLALGSAAATSTNYTYRLVQDAVVEIPAGYTGIIVGIWATAPGGNAYVTELT